MVSASITMFVFLNPYLMPRGTFSITLTTQVFDQRSLWWFATRSCKPIVRGHTLISYAACYGTLMSDVQTWFGTVGVKFLVIRLSAPASNLS